MISLIDRYRGSLVGVLCGDALGAPYETWTEERIRADIDVRGGLVLFDYDDPWGKDGRFPKGRPTDDSELTTALAENLIAGGDLEFLYQRFRSCVVDRVSTLCELPAYGFGGTTRRALKYPTLAESVAARTERPHIPSNGALMRTAPVALRYRNNQNAVFESAMQNASVTHRHQEAMRAAVVYSLVHERILAGETYENAVSQVADVPLFRRLELLALLCAPAEKPPAPEKFGGGAAYTLQVMHYAVGTSSSFEEGITKAVTQGSDTDTYAAVAGGLLGALYGIDAIPERWKNNLLGRAKMERLADSLYDLSVRR